MYAQLHESSASSWFLCRDHRSPSKSSRSLSSPMLAIWSRSMWRSSVSPCSVYVVIPRFGWCNGQQFIAHPERSPFAKHPHIVKLVKVMHTRDKLYVVQDYLSNGDLRTALRNESPIPEPTVRMRERRVSSAIAVIAPHHRCRWGSGLPRFLLPWTTATHGPSAIATLRQLTSCSTTIEVLTWQTSVWRFERHLGRH